MSEQPLEGEVVEPEQPREGTLAWLRLQPHQEVLGRLLPSVHRLDIDHGSLVDTEDGKCQYMRPEKGRCGAPRLPSYGICLVHAGGGARDLDAMSKLAHAQKARLRVARTQLGVGARRASDPRQLSRIAAQARANEIAEALLAPLDDEGLGAMNKQRAATTILDALWPQQTTTVTVELPADQAGVEQLSWPEMQQLAATLMGDTAETEPS